MTTEAEAIRDLAQKAITAQTIETAAGREFLIVPEGTEVQEISDEHKLSVTLPRYIKQKIALQTQELAGRLRQGIQALRAIEWVICEAEGLTNRCIV